MKMENKQTICGANCSGCSKFGTASCPHSYWMEEMNPERNYCIAWEAI